MTRERNTPRWFPRSLRRQLLLGVLAVVSVVLVAIGVVSVLSLRGYVTTMNDAEVAKSLHAFTHSYDRYRKGEHSPVHPTTPPIAEALLEFVLPRAEREGKAYLTVAVGCTGGRHRSVAVVQELAKKLPERHPLTVRHRDLGRGRE